MIQLAALTRFRPNSNISHALDTQLFCNDDSGSLCNTKRCGVGVLSQCEYKDNTCNRYDLTAATFEGGMERSERNELLPSYQGVIEQLSRTSNFEAFNAVHVKLWVNDSALFSRLHGARSELGGKLVDLKPRQ